MRTRLPYYPLASPTVSFQSYFPYISIKIIAKAIEVSEPLDRETFMANLKKIEMKDALGRIIKFDENGAALTGYYINRVTKINPADRTFKTDMVDYIDFPPGQIPVYEIARKA